MTGKALLGAILLGWCALASAEKKDYQVSRTATTPKKTQVPAP
jgi:hypothetical protein